MEMVEDIKSMHISKPRLQYIFPITQSSNASLNFYENDLTFDLFAFRVLTISSDLETVLQVLNEIVPNLEEVRSTRIFFNIIISYF